MNIALISTGLGHISRGIETWTEDLGRELKARGIDVTVYKGGGKKEQSYERVISCLKRDNGFSKLLIKNRPGFMWRLGLATGYTLEQKTFCWNILPELILKQYDIIHTQDPQVAEFFQGVANKKLIKSKVILAHGTEESFGFLGKLDYVQHLAPFHLEEARSNGVKNKQDFAIGNFIDTDIFKPGDGKALRAELGIPENAFVVLSVAAIKKAHKRIDYLIEEVARLQNDKVYLVVAGSTGLESAEVMALGKEKLGEHVNFLTNFPRERIMEVYQAADVFALCSLKDMMPIALLEAISSGLPALVHKYPVEEWMIGSGGTAINMGKEWELAQTLLMYMDPLYREEKGKLAREHAVTNFARDVIMEKILGMYELVMDDK